MLPVLNSLISLLTIKITNCAVKCLIVVYVTMQLILKVPNRHFLCTKNIIVLSFCSFGVKYDMEMFMTDLCCLPLGSIFLITLLTLTNDVWLLY